MTRRAGSSEHWWAPEHEWLYLENPSHRGPSGKLEATWHVPDYHWVPWAPYEPPNGTIVWAHSLGASPPWHPSQVWDAMMAYYDVRAEKMARQQEKRREAYHVREARKRYAEQQERREYEEFRIETLRRYGLAE